MLFLLFCRLQGPCEGILDLIKRCFDLAIGSVIFLLASPVLLILWVLIRWNMGKPALFRQARPGFQGRTFDLIKFRTMSDRRDASGHLLSDGERLTILGVWMRRLSLDELPQLFNVIKGEMSLVGPRPLLVQYLERYSPEQARRHEVKPGITGWAQVNGRNALSWEDKFVLDVWYVDHRSFWLDLKILFLTVLRVVKRDGISASGEATISEFIRRSR